MSNYPILQRKQIVVTSLYNYIVSPARKTQIKYKNNQPNDIPFHWFVRYGIKSTEVYISKIAKNKAIRANRQTQTFNFILNFKITQPKYKRNKYR